MISGPHRGRFHEKKASICARGGRCGLPLSCLGKQTPYPPPSVPLAKLPNEAIPAASGAVWMTARATVGLWLDGTAPRAS